MNRPSAPLENHAAPESLSPDWLAEIMNEIARRFDLTTADGLNQAEEAAVRFSDDFPSALCANSTASRSERDACSFSGALASASGSGARDSRL